MSRQDLSRISQPDTPPEIPADLDLDAWLDSPTWHVRVPTPFRVSATRVSGSPDSDGWTEFSPSEHPWLATEFAHVAAGLDDVSSSDEPPLEVAREAERFVARYGLTAEWPEVRDPEEVPVPLEMALSQLLRDAWEIREVLLAYRGTLPRDRQVNVSFESPIEPLIAFFAEAQTLLAISIRVGLDEGLARPTIHVNFDYPLSLLNVMRMQLLADLVASRPIVECQRRGCGKLFIWSRGRAGAPARSAGMRGPIPQFCSYSHAQAELRDRRLQREGD